MKELFGEFGKLNKVAMHYDKNGKPQGTCDIHFAQKTDAVRALRKYNKVPLDGRPMEIKIVEDLAAKPRIVKPQPVANRIRNAVRPWLWWDQNLVPFAFWSFLVKNFQTN